MTDSRKISVIIPTYNYGRFIGEAVRSALGQTVAPEEVVVVDDGSTDDTAEVVGRFGDRVKYVRQENAGVCAARNRGVAESSGRLIAFLDADDIWEPTKLEKQSALFSKDTSVGLVHCGMREFDSETGQTISVLLEGLDGDVADELLLWERPAIIGPGGTIMVSRTAFDEVGGFDPRLKVGEDWDFCYRVARKYRVGFVREPLVNYRSHGAAAHRNVANMEAGMGMFYTKAFEDPAAAHLKSRSYGNFHKVLAGSYFTARNYGQFARHAALSVWNRPANFAYFLKYPLRILRRRSSSPPHGS